MFKGYFKQPEETRRTLTPDGWILTGDAGYLDERGRLVVIDRVATSPPPPPGVRFSPQFIENKLKFSPYIGECVVLGNGRPSITAILCMRYSMVGEMGRGSRAGLHDLHPPLGPARGLRADRSARSRRSTPRCRRRQRITRFLLLYKELDADDGELTRTRKVRRGVIDERYRVLIEALYSGPTRSRSRPWSPSRTVAPA